MGLHKTFGIVADGDGEMVGAGINQLQYYDTFYNPDANSQGKGKFEESGQQIMADDSVIEKGDPYYNPNFSLDRSDFALKI